MGIWAWIGYIASPLVILGLIYSGGRWMFRWLFPLKIKVYQGALCTYDNTRREYIIIVSGVEIYIRRPITPQNKYIQFKGDKKGYIFPSVDEDYQRIEKTETFEMHFTTEVYDEEDMAERPLSNSEIRGRIIIGRCKSRWFFIRKGAEIVIKRQDKNEL